MALETGALERCRAIVAVVPLLLLVAIATPSADAARTVRHSGTVAALDPEGRVMILDEVGPWRLERGATVVTRRTIRLTPSTTYNLFMRVDVPGGFAGDFIEVMLDVGDIAPGDFVTVDSLHQDARLIALAVTVAELP